MSNTFWIDDPTILFRRPRIIPNMNMTEYERLNAITSLIIIITIILWILKLGSWIIFLIFGFSLVIMLYIFSTANSMRYTNNMNHIYSSNLLNSQRLNLQKSNIQRSKMQRSNSQRANLNFLDMNLSDLPNLSNSHNPQNLNLIENLYCRHKKKRANKNNYIIFRSSKSK